MHSKSYDARFIVKVFEKTDKEPFFCGTGFLYSEYLITASHLFRGRISEKENRIGQEEYFFEFEDKPYPLENVFYDEYEHGDDIDVKNGIRKDLRIYKTKNFNSPYQLFSGNYPWQTKLYFDGWCVDEKEDIVNRSNSEIIGENAYWYCRRMDNCFKLFDTIAVEGNSGCPILDKDIVYGMYFGSRHTEGKAIRSDYILEKINSIIGADL
jgi:hypothetical protein